jgi:ribokinase
MLDHVNVLVPNRIELAMLCEAEVPTSMDGITDLARRMARRCDVVVTLGADGALVCQREQVRHVPAPDVKVVDTTAAGDAVCGALADGLTRGLKLEDAARRAVRAASFAVTRAGAQQALPRAEDLM